MRYFLCRRIPPRPSFPLDMTDREAQVMREHVTYWTGLAETGVAIAFGPVADPQGTWGLGILKVNDDAEAVRPTSNHPVMTQALVARYEGLPIPRIVFGKPLSRLSGPAPNTPSRI